MEHLIHLDTEKKIRHTLSAPFIYSLIFPVVILDFFIEMYHHVCFPLYELDLVNRSAYVKIDRHKLSYLTPKQKINCAYCGYVNGVFAYWVKIAADTEKYWCGIQHEKDQDFLPPKHHKDFVDFNDPEAFEKRYQTSGEQNNDALGIEH
jgi:hypothetical protein